jgi:hypothetical protein
MNSSVSAQKNASNLHSGGHPVQVWPPAWLFQGFMWCALGTAHKYQNGIFKKSQPLPIPHDSEFMVFVTHNLMQNGLRKLIQGY